MKFAMQLSLTDEILCLMVNVHFNRLYSRRFDHAATRMVLRFQEFLYHQASNHSHLDALHLLSYPSWVNPFPFSKLVYCLVESRNTG